MKRITNQTVILTLLAISAFVFSSACGEAKTENKNAQTNAIAGGGNTVSPNANKPANVEKTPVQAQENKQSDELPKFEQDEDYKKSVRQKLLKAGWTPARSAEGDSNCSGQQSLCDELPELEAGPSSPQGQAATRWKKGDKILLISTIDNFLYLGYEYEKPKKTKTIPNIEGKYVYSSKHEYGEDQYIFELKAKNIATYVAEVEGGDGPDWKGTWEWNETDKTVIVTFADSGNEGNKTYVFKLVGNDLKMIKEPKMPEGVRGFSGNIYRKK